MIKHLVPFHIYIYLEIGANSQGNLPGSGGVRASLHPTLQNTENYGSMVSNTPVTIGLTFNLILPN